jgi:hypothetical protein
VTVTSAEPPNDLIQNEGSPNQLFLPIVFKPYTPDSLTLVAHPNAMLMTNSIIFTATVQQKGLPIPNYPVFFTTTLGSLTPLVGTTNANGIATAILSGTNQVGIATVKASVNSGTNTITEMTSLTITAAAQVPLTSTNWTYSGDEPQALFAQNSILLGNNDPSACKGGLPIPGDWHLTSQPLSAPQGATQATIRVDFQLFTFDRNTPLSEGFDFFKIQINGKQSQQPLAEELFANDTLEQGCHSTPYIIDGPFDASFKLAGNSEFIIEMYLANRLDQFYNTWVEIHKIDIIWE